MREFDKLATERQSHYRNTGRDISQEARTPNDPTTKEHGHLLANGCGAENLYADLRPNRDSRGKAQDFFEKRRIKWWGQKGIDADNCPSRNLKSSQLCCVNFLLPYTEDESVCTAILQAIDPDVEKAVPISYEQLSSYVEFEWVGQPTCLEGGVGTRGAVTTSADALMLGETNSGIRRGYVFEWKYSERYVDPSKNDISRSGSNETRRERYKPWLQAEKSSFLSDVSIDDLFFEPFYQLMRLRLLGDMMVSRREQGITEATVVVVCPEHNYDYRLWITSVGIRKRSPKARDLEEVFRGLLKRPREFLMISQERLLWNLRQSPLSPKLAPWIEYHSERYGW